MGLKKSRRWLCALLTLALLALQLGAFSALAEQPAQSSQLVLTLGADLSKQQRAYVLKYFGIEESQAKVITITHADEQEQLGGLVSAEVIGTHTLSCALIRLTNSGGIQVKTANMNFVTSNMIASTLSTSGVYNCEVLTVAPFEVSGTGALTGVMMAYEAGTGQQLDPEKKSLANEELVITGEIADSVGQDQATLIVNDIKIHIVRDGVTGQDAVNNVVDEVIETTQSAAAEAAQKQGKPAPAKLGAVETERLYGYGYKFSQIGYSYADMAPTLERVTRNITKTTGIVDPITDTFITSEDDELSIDSILLGTQDDTLGDDAIINATNTVALGDHPAEIIDVFTGDVRLTEAGKIKAESFIRGSNLVAFKDVGGGYALMDLNGNTLTQSIYTEDFDYNDGYIVATTMVDGCQGVLNTDGTTVVPFQYDVADALGTLWGVGYHLAVTSGDDYDFFGGSKRYVIDTADLYYFGRDSMQPVATLTREQYANSHATGDYLNIADRNGAVTTYDSNFQAVQYPDSLYDSSYDEASRAAKLLSKQLDMYVERFKGNYAMVSFPRNAYSHGLIDRYGNIIVPAQFDYFLTSDSDLYFSSGYVGAKLNDQFVYVTQGGTVTATFTGVDYYDVRNSGMAAYAKSDDGSYTLLSGDGIMTNLGTKYSSFNSITDSKGMLWRGRNSDYTYDLLDWHGNVLLSGYDNYSVSGNGNYLIVQDGYTSSTLYLINDASPVAITESAGAAVELQEEVREGASLEAFTGEPTLQLLGSLDVEGFIDGTDLMYGEDSSTGAYRIIDINGQSLSQGIYQNIEYDSGWLKVSLASDGACGLLAMNGAQVIPCEYDTIVVLNEHWAAAYHLTPGATEEDSDFYGYDENSNRVYYTIAEAVICHMTETEVSSVRLTRDQLADIEASDDYINVQDRTSGSITTYDSTFTAVATVDRIYDFTGFSAEGLAADMIHDQTGYSIYDEDFPDGYTRVSDDRNGSLMGVVDMNGQVVLPVQYDRIDFYSTDTQHFWANGYFCVKQGDLFGYVTAGGVVTCDIAYPSDNFYNWGMSARVKQSDGTYSIVAADGIVTDGFEYLQQPSGGNGMFWITYNSESYGYDLLDWHGNKLLINQSNVCMSTDGKYLLAREDYSSPRKLYGINGAAPEGGFVGLAAQTPVTETPVPEAPATEAPVPENTATPEPVQAPDQGGTADVSGAYALLTSADSLVNAGLDTNRTAIVTLLQQAETLLSVANPNAGALVTSARMLVEANSTDAASISTLLQTAMTLLSEP